MWTQEFKANAATREVNTSAHQKHELRWLLRSRTGQVWSGVARCGKYTIHYPIIAHWKTLRYIRSSIILLQYELPSCGISYCFLESLPFLVRTVWTNSLNKTYYNSITHLLCQPRITNKKHLEVCRSYFLMAYQVAYQVRPHLLFGILQSWWGHWARRTGWSIKKPIRFLLFVCFSFWLRVLD